MKKSLLALTFLAVPVAALALDFTESSARYADSASFSRAERAGISVLTNLGAVAGNPDGTFAAGRTLNRAEFLKIVLKSAPSLNIIDTDEASCFPDVRAEDWFSIYVCAAKRRGMVEGYPDGNFKPANPVNYVEAVKILAGLYGYDLPEPAPYERWAWYTPYLRASMAHGVLLSEEPAYDAFLTRGQMARLAAAYRTEHDGELSSFRAWESGQSVSSPSSSSSLSTSSASSTSSSTGSSASSVSSSSSLLSASSASSSASQAALFPAVSRFLVAGETSPVILDGTFSQVDEDGVLRRVTVTFRREVRSFDELILVNAAGGEIVRFELATSSNTDNRRFEAVVTDERLTIAKGTSIQLGIRAVLKPRDDGGVSNELVEVENFSIDVQGKTTGGTRQIVPTATHYPMHQTTQGNILSVKNLLSGGTVQAGKDRQIASFAISGRSVTGATLTLNSMEFILQKTNLAATNIHIGGPAAIEQEDCGLEQTDILRVTCTVIPEAYRSIGSAPRMLSIYADLAVSDSSNTGSVQLLFEGRGEIGRNGALRWSDGTTVFNWIESTASLENGPQWTVTK